jgi:hypothetical protein
VIFWESGTSQNFYIEINRNLIIDLRIFTLRTVFNERITFVNEGWVYKVPRNSVNVC